MKNNKFLMIAFATTLLLAACDNSEGESAQGGGPGGPPGQGGPAQVEFIEVAKRPLAMKNELPGRVVSFRQSEIRPQVSGLIQSRLFEEGSLVEKGDQLYQIDPARYKATYNMALAQLKNAKAARQNSQLLMDRYEGLINSKAVSAQEFDNAKAQLDQAKAAVALAQAEVQAAKINVDYTKVYAPISGYISPSSVTEGALVTAQQAEPLATIRQLDPVYVDLSKSVSEVRAIQSRLSSMKMDGEENAQFKVDLILNDTDKVYPIQGVVDATDLSVDQTTGTIRLRTTFDNPDNILLPGMFVRARIIDITKAPVMTVPQKAVNITPEGEYSVWVIQEGKAMPRIITVSGSNQGDWIVESGIAEGDQIIVRGAMMLRPETPVQGRNASQIANQAAQNDKSMEQSAPPPEMTDGDNEEKSVPENMEDESAEEPMIGEMNDKEGE